MTGCSSSVREHLTLLEVRDSVILDQVERKVRTLGAVRYDAWCTQNDNDE